LQYKETENKIVDGTLMHFKNQTLYNNKRQI